MSPTWPRSFRRTIAILLGLNAFAAVFAVSHRYIIDLPFLRFPAQEAFKPLLLLNAAVILAFLVRGGVSSAAAAPLFEWGNAAAGFAIAFTTVCANLSTFAVNFWDHDWTHRHIGADLNSWAKVGSLFVHPQVDGMYRPLAFLSFRLDYQIFGEHLWGYHLQSVLVHAINAVLVWALGRRLGLSPAASFVSGMAFGTLATHFEAVLWPAARFDLLAAMFALVSIILFLDFCDARGRRSFLLGVLSLVAFLLSVLNKESGYCLVVVLPVLAIWRGRPRKTIPYFLVLTILTGALLALRLFLFHGTGGYDHQSGGSVASDLSWKAAYSVVANVIGLTLFAQNATLSSPVESCIAAAWVVFAGALIWSPVADDAGTRRRLLGLALLSALPALPVMAWIRPNLQHTRHLYFPSVWISIFIATVLRPRRIATVVFLVLQCAALNWNVWVYRYTGQLTKSAAAEISSDISGAKRIRLVNIPPYQNGVWYFDSELQHQVQLAAPQAPVMLCVPTPCAAEAGDLVYGWDAEKGRLVAAPR